MVSCLIHTPLSKFERNMMKKYKTLILLSFLLFFMVTDKASAESKTSWWGWGKKHEQYRQMNGYHPYLENSRHVQIPQWAHKDWYAEDWTSQKDGMTLVRGFYAADILRDQITAKKSALPILVVGPNFYRLSGYDKRRVAHIVDVTYGITDSRKNGAFLLQDWNTRAQIGVFDENGLRLH